MKGVEQCSELEITFQNLEIKETYEEGAFHEKDDYEVEVMLKNESPAHLRRIANHTALSCGAQHLRICHFLYFR